VANKSVGDNSQEQQEHNSLTRCSTALIYLQLYVFSYLQLSLSYLVSLCLAFFLFSFFPALRTSNGDLRVQPIQASQQHSEEHVPYGYQRWYIHVSIHAVYSPCSLIMISTRSLALECSIHQGMLKFNYDNPRINNHRSRYDRTRKVNPGTWDIDALTSERYNVVIGQL
jgi:hypothetical protein